MNTEVGKRRIAIAVIACTLLSAATVHLALAQAPAIGTFHDDGVYLVTAKALAEGQGYRIISIPGEPPQTKYPILFPWLLSLVWRLNPSFPANLPWLRLVPIAAALGWLCLSWPLLRRLGASTAQTAAIVLLTAASPWVAFLSTALMSETLFAFILTAALLMITRAYQGDGTRVDPLIAGFLLGAAVLTRMAGVAPAAAGVAAFLLAKRWMSAVQCLLGIAVFTLPWFWWVSHQPPATMIDSYYSATNYASWNIVTSYAWPEKLSVLGMNALVGGLAFTEIWGLHVPYAMPALLLAVAALILVGRGLWRARRQPAAMVMVAYCAIHAAWVWTPLRFLVPGTPLFLWFAFIGAGKRQRLGYAAALALLTAGGFQLWTTVAQAREKGIVSPVSGAEDWADTARALNWVLHETPHDATLTGNLDPMYYLYTGRKAVRAFATDPYLLFYNVRRRSENPLGTADGLRSRLIAIKADYLFITPGREEIRHLRRLVSELAQGCPGALTPVVGSSDSNHVIYRIDRQRLERLETCANTLSRR